ncbi:MAG TPA: sigma 54-interacting transcriptional regulator [Rectinemataceae bacterium]|nr:sigma 54-interacting transcriptional regulator [Rectinemataceae bacterium]
MKSIAIVTDSPKGSLWTFLRSNLELVLSGFVELNNRFLDEVPSDLDIPDDIVLVMTKAKAVDVKNRTRDAKRIIVVNRTIQKSEIYRICSIPPGTRVLVVNDNAETTLEMVSLLYKLGIDHLDLVPFDPQKYGEDSRIAITPGEQKYVPKHIDTIIDTGHRYIDISTFIQIVDMLKLAEREVNERLLRYSEGIIPLDSGINAQYRELFIKNQELDAILNLTHEGVLLVDNDGEVRLHNRALSLMLETKSDMTGRKLDEFVQEPLLSLLDQTRLDNELLRYHERSFVVTGRALENFGEKSGYYLNFRDVTYIRQLEQSLDRKLQDQGFLPKYGFDDISTESPLMRERLALARKFARSDLPVLISGESGTGKELMAHAIHSASERSSRPFVAFNCAAVAESLIESELFGYEAGSFTGALKSGKIGLFEQANNGSVFLDEIGDMPYVLQSKLLRVLQERQVMRVGSQKITSVNIRVIAASNQNLGEKVAAGLFREDLYYRLNVLPLILPALRQRPEDILFLFRRFLGENGKAGLSIAPEAERALLRHRWPGNIRELWNVAAYAAFVAEEELGLDCLPESIASGAGLGENAAPGEKADDWGAEDVVGKVGEGDGGRPSPLAEEAVREVLVALSELETGQGVGRASLRAMLEGKGSHLSEARIRRSLELLNEAGLIESGIGRQGSRITQRGAALVNRSGNR